MTLVDDLLYRAGRTQTVPPSTPVAIDQLSFELFTDLIALPQEKDTPPPDVTAKPAVSLAHVWIVAAEIKADRQPDRP